MRIFNYQWPIINGIGLLILAYVMTEPFDLELLFHDTILTGGDGGSWYQIALHLKETLIPNARLFGWDQGNFFGYANLQHYFVLPFLSVVLLSYIVPLTVALKLISVIGLFTLPFAVFWALGKFKYHNPIPLAGAWLSLIFLFHERYSMFGGNLLSTFAGEFCYSIAFVLMVFFMGSLQNDMQQHKFSLRSGVMLGLIGLSHAFVFFVALLMPIFFYITKPTNIKIKIILLIYLLGFFVMAFWALPMLSNLNFTTPISLNWRFKNMSEFLHASHVEVLLIVGILLLTYIYKPFRSQCSFFFLYMIVVSIILYLTATALHVPDIRFFPPLLFFSLLFILDRFAVILHFQQIYKNLASLSVLGLCILFGGSWVYKESNMAPQWFNWNYSGYENKPAFQDGRAKNLFASLQGNFNDPRVAWEQGDHNTDFGTARVFENIPLFTGRASTEGVHYASALLSLPITILNGEYSHTPASPSANIYSHYFVDKLPDRFDLLNIRDFIAFTPEITQLFRESSAYEVISQQPPYTVFRWKDFNSNYIATPKYQPFVTENYTDWKNRFINWFRRADNLDISLINGKLLPADFHQYLVNQNPVTLEATGIMPTMPQKIPLEPANISQVSISNFKISFTTDKPDTPHIVKFSYSPNWYSKHNEAIAMVAPGFMLIYPETTRVELVYGRHWSEYLGMGLSVCGILFMFYFARKKSSLASILSLPAFEKSIASTLKLRKPVLGMMFLLVIIVCTWSYLKKQEIYTDLQKANSLLQAGKPEKAILHLQKNTEMDKIANIDNVDIPVSIYTLAKTYRNLGKIELAKAEFYKLIKYYPRWIFIDEIYWHLGSIAYAENNYAAAKTLFEQCLSIDKFGINAKRCQQDLEQTIRILQ